MSLFLACSLTGLRSIALVCMHACRGVGIVSEAEEFSHEEFDQEMLAGGMDGRKQIKDLTPEEATKEIR